MYTEKEIQKIAKKVRSHWNAEQNRATVNLSEIVRLVLREANSNMPQEDTLAAEPVIMPATTQLFTNRYARNLSPTKFSLEEDTKVSIIETKMMKYGGEPCVAVCFIHRYKLVWVIIEYFMDDTFF